MTMKLDAQRILLIGQPNKNGRIYTEDAANRLALLARQGILSGEFTGNDETSVNLQNVTHVVENVRVDGDYVIADVKILDTPQGLVLQDMIKAKLTPKFYSRGCGVVDIATGTIVDYVPISVDVTLDSVSHED